MLTPALFVLAASCALIAGWTVNQGGICAVAATGDLIIRRSSRLAIGIGLASAVAGIGLLPAAWTFGDHVGLSGSVDWSGALVIGGVLIGVGAVVNDACLFGSLARLGNGETRFLALPAGLALGYFLVSDCVGVHRRVAVGFAHPGIAGASLVAASCCVAALGVFILRTDDVHRFERRLPLSATMIVLGIVGSILYAMVPGWTFADVLHHWAGPTMANVVADAVGSWLALLTIIGAVLAAKSSGRFKLQAASTAQIARTVFGGALMAMGAAHIPGGNDSLLLAGLPSGSSSSAIAFVVMSLTIAASVFCVHRWRIVVPPRLI